MLPCSFFLFQRNRYTIALSRIALCICVSRRSAILDRVKSLPEFVHGPAINLINMFRSFLSNTFCFILASLDNAVNCVFCIRGILPRRSHRVVVVVCSGLI